MRTATAGLPEAAEPLPNEGALALGPGVRLGAYELLAPVASGGMGHVWSAVRIGDFGFRRAVAVKVMREELAGDPGFRRMFLDEARLASGISHSNVVQVLDLGESSGTIFLAMALVEGDSLAHLLATAKRRGDASVPPAVIARIVADVLRGLHAAHELRGGDGALLGFVHRDVSPQNVLVGVDGVAKITDFGVAKAAGAAERASRSHRKGKVAYMAPEQFHGGAIDRRSDVFAIGVMLWELLTAARMPTDASPITSSDALAHPCQIDPAANRALADVAMKALARAPDDRFATAEEMADAVERAAHESGLVASSKSVAAWVAPLASEDVERRRHDTEEQLARSRAETIVEATADTTTVARASPRATWPVAVALVGTVAVASAVGLMAKRSAPAVAAPPFASSTSATAFGGSLAPTSTSTSTSTSTPTPTSTSTSTPTPTSTSTSTSTPTSTSTSPSPSPRPAPKPLRKSAPKPKYDNPYEGAPR